MNKIPLVMETLSKYFNKTERTTLNRMRENLATSVGGSERSRRSTLRGKSKKTSGLSSDAFKILISCLLSLRAKDATTEIISEKLFAIADTPEKIANMPITKLEEIIFSSGHYHKKAKTLKSVSEELIKRFSSKVPSEKEKLLSIKGIGPKTTNIVLAFAFDKSVLPIDTHCHRIPNRLGWIKTKTPEQTEKELEKILPKEYWKEFNGIFVLFGKTICQPISPWCSECPVEKYCEKISVGKSR